MIAEPMPARTIAMTVPLSTVRNTVTGRTPSALQAVLDAVHVARRWVGHHLHAVERLDGDGAVGELAAAGDEHVGIVEQGDALDVAARRADAEAEVELAGEHLGDRRHLVLVQPDVGAGVLVAEAREHRRQQHVRHALERADVDAATLTGLEPLERVGRRLRPGEDVTGVGQHQLAERREPYRAGTAGAVEHRAADRALERGDLLADRRLRVPEAIGGLAEGALGGHRVERGEVAQLEAGEPAEAAADGGFRDVHHAASLHPERSATLIESIDDHRFT